MSRRQIAIFSVLLIITVVLFSLHEQAKLRVSIHLSSILLFPVKSVTEFLRFLAISNTRITELEKQVSKLRLENSEFRKKILLDTTGYQITGYSILKAQIIGRDPSNINGYLYIDKGQKDDIMLDQPVISINGLVGKIKYVTKNYSIVETVENQSFAVSAQDIQTGIHGIIKKQAYLKFDFIGITDEIYVDDLICTSGMSNIFPEGIPIGYVTRIGKEQDLFFKPIVVSPAVKINRLTYVYIILSRDEQNSASDIDWSLQPID